MYESITVSVPTGLKKKFQKKCKENEKSMYLVLKNFVIEYVEEKPFNK